MGEKFQVIDKGEGVRVLDSKTLPWFDGLTGQSAGLIMYVLLALACYALAVWGADKELEPAPAAAGGGPSGTALPDAPIAKKKVAKDEAKPAAKKKTAKDEAKPAAKKKADEDAAAVKDTPAAKQEPAAKGDPEAD